MKKNLIVFFCCILALMLVFTGCSGKPAGQENVLRVAMECSYAPYNWTQSDNANGAMPIADSKDYAYGYDVMMAKHIADKLGMELQIVKIDWDSLVPAVQSGTVDCVIAGQSVTPDRAEIVDFTDPYYFASIVTLVMADGPYADATGISGLAKATCTSQLGTIWYNTCLGQIPEANILPGADSAPAMLMALSSGACDIVCTDLPTAQAAAVAYPNLKVLDFSDVEDNYVVSEDEINICVSLQKGNTELLDSINGVLAEMTVEDYDAMMKEAIAAQPLSK